MNAMTKMKDRRESEEFTVESYDGKEISPETFETVLVQAEKVISKVLADLKCCSEKGKAVLGQML